MREGMRRMRCVRWREAPGFTIASVLTLADRHRRNDRDLQRRGHVLLQPFPFPDADRLVRIREPERPPAMQPMNYQELLEWRSRTTTLSGIAAGTFNPQLMMATRDGTVRLAGGFVSSNYFEVLGSSRRCLAGSIQSSDDANPDVVVLTYETWHRYFRADSRALGR